MIKCVAKFSGVGGSKWSELYYFAGNVSSSNVGFTSLMQIARCAFLDKRSMLRSVRYSNPDGNLRASFPIDLSLNGTWDSGTTDPDQAGQAIVYTLSSANPLASRKIVFHGLNEDQTGVNIATSQPYVGQATKSAINEFLNIYATGGGVIRCLIRGVVVGAGLIQVNSIARSMVNAENTVLTCAEAHGLTRGQQCLIRGADRKTAPGLNGVYMVLAVDGLWLTVNYKAPAAATVFNAGCFIRANTFNQSAAITSFSYHSVVSRKVKGSFFDSRGARSRRALRHLA